ncbi:MAG: hypothetical protein IK082_08215 [Oscillospiraceae bacterium]|nr:hypothetical protein [Oscillospiraceae bacterium]
MRGKAFSAAGMIVSALIVIFGILFLAGALTGETYRAGGAGMYDSGYASFGADFYTYVSNNAAEAASAGRAAASNLDDIFHLARTFGGIFLTGFGLLGFCLFGMKWKECAGETAAKKPETAAAGGPWTGTGPEPAGRIDMEESWITEPVSEAAEDVQAAEAGVAEKITENTGEIPAAEERTAPRQ